MGLPKESFQKEMAQKYENQAYDRQFGRILDREIASWEYFFVETLRFSLYQDLMSLMPFLLKTSASMRNFLVSGEQKK